MGTSPAGWVEVDAVEPFDVIATGLKNQGSRAVYIKGTRSLKNLPELIRPAKEFVCEEGVGGTLRLRSRRMRS